MSLTAGVWIKFDPVQDTGLPTGNVAVTCILDRWKLHDFWLVGYEAFEPVTGGYVRDGETLDRNIDARQFSPSSPVLPDNDLGHYDELPLQVTRG